MREFGRERKKKCVSGALHSTASVAKRAMMDQMNSSLREQETQLPNLVRTWWWYAPFFKHNKQMGSTPPKYICVASVEQNIIKQFLWHPYQRGDDEFFLFLSHQIIVFFDLLVKGNQQNKSQQHKQHTHTHRSSITSHHITSHITSLPFVLYSNQFIPIQSSLKR